MCSKRCANPVRPGRSFFEPTWNHSFTCTIGSLRSTCRITCSPFGSVNFSNASFGVSAEADARCAVAGAVAFAAALAGSWAGLEAGAWSASDSAPRQTKPARDTARDARGRDMRDAITEVLLWCCGGESVGAAPLYPKPVDRAPGCDEQDELAVGTRAAALR